MCQWNLTLPSDVEVFKDFASVVTHFLLAGVNPYYTDGKTWHPNTYGSVNGSNAWLTTTQAIATGESSTSGGTYPLFQMGAACALSLRTSPRVPSSFTWFCSF